ncbi:MAG: hypothetical protein HC872_01900 [Gammaproteobacteria bacterium]|nr:hypothetical protein [Gammaproteobacteria bacterium]
MTEIRSQRIRQLVAVTCTALVLGAGLVLAGQGTGRADQSIIPTERERRPMWTPGSDVPMSVYVEVEQQLPAPPR